MPLKNYRVFKRQMHLIVLLTACCESALRFRRIATVQDSLRNADKSYAAALRNMGRLSLSTQDAADFEDGAIELESAITKLTVHLKLLVESVSTQAVFHKGTALAALDVTTVMIRQEGAPSWSGAPRRRRSVSIAPVLPPLLSI